MVSQLQPPRSSHISEQTQAWMCRVSIPNRITQSRARWPLVLSSKDSFAFKSIALINTFNRKASYFKKSSVKRGKWTSAHVICSCRYESELNLMIRLFLRQMIFLAMSRHFWRATPCENLSKRNRVSWHPCQINSEVWCSRRRELRALPLRWENCFYRNIVWRWWFFVFCLFV